MYELIDIWGAALKEISFLGFIALLAVSTIIGLFLLTKGGDLLSDNCSVLARELGVPPVIVGLTIVSVATSAPELFTSISAINSGAGGLVLGNIIGSNVANIGLILGISLLIKPISTYHAVKPIQLVLLVIATIGFSSSIIFSQTAALGFNAGVILIVFILGYLTSLCFVALRNRNIETESREEIKDDKQTLLMLACMILTGGLLLWLGSESLVYGSKNLAEIVGIPNELIGFTLIAIGTSLPELAASIALLKKNETHMLLGNIIGSNLFNIGLVGGVAGILGPIFCETPYPWLDHLSMLLFTVLLIVWMGGKDLKRKHGIMLLILYVLTSATTWVANS